MNKSPLKSLSNGELQSAAQYFRALGEVSRLRLLQVLNSGEKSVSDLAEHSGLNQSNVSRHLSVLLAAKIIKNRKQGTSVLYTVVDPSLAEVCAPVCKRVLKDRNHNSTRGLA